MLGELSHSEVQVNLNNFRIVLLFRFFTQKVCLREKLANIGEWVAKQKRKKSLHFKTISLPREEISLIACLKDPLFSL